MQCPRNQNWLVERVLPSKSDQDLVEVIAEHELRRMIRQRFGSDRGFEVSGGTDGEKAQILRVREVVPNAELHDPWTQIRVRDAVLINAGLEPEDDVVEEIAFHTFERRALRQLCQQLRRSVTAMRATRVFEELTDCLGEVVAAEIQECRSPGRLVLRSGLEIHVNSGAAADRSRFQSGDALRAVLQEVRLSARRGVDVVLIEEDPPQLVCDSVHVDGQADADLGECCDAVGQSGDAVALDAGIVQPPPQELARNDREADERFDVLIAQAVAPVSPVHVMLHPSERASDDAVRKAPDAATPVRQDAPPDLDAAASAEPEDVHEEEDRAEPDLEVAEPSGTAAPPPVSVQVSALAKQLQVKPAQIETFLHRNGLADGLSGIGNAATVVRKDAVEAVESHFSASWEEEADVVPVSADPDFPPPDIGGRAGRWAEVVAARVIGVGHRDVILDIGEEYDGIAFRSEFDDGVAVGAAVEVVIEHFSSELGAYVVSKGKADRLRRWEYVSGAYAQGTTLEAIITRHVKGGMRVVLPNGTEAFVPASQLSARPIRDFTAYLGVRMPFRIIAIDEIKNSVVVSHTVLLRDEIEAARRRLLNALVVGQTIEGTVKNIVSYGAFIDLGGADGLLHVTDMAWDRPAHPSDLVRLDQRLTLVVLAVDLERERISLGLKQLQPDPWDTLAERYKVGDIVAAEVVAVRPYGAIVKLERGIEGLIHFTEMSWNARIRRASQVVTEGQMVRGVVLRMDREARRLAIGMKQLTRNPWDGLADRYPPGSIVRVRVRNWVNFGVFAEIEEGVEGLIYISNLSWTRKHVDTGAFFEMQQEIDVKVLEIDEARQRISLGYKQLQPNPWPELADVLGAGSHHQAQVLRVEEEQLVVVLPQDVEARVPADALTGSLSDYREGDGLMVQVLSMNWEEQEIQLCEAEPAEEALPVQAAAP